MSLIEIIRQIDSHTVRSFQIRKFYRLGQSVVPAWAARQARLKTGIRLATMIALAILSASGSIAFSAVRSQGVTQLSANSVAFGSVVVDTTSPAKKIALENTGSASLSISSVAVSGMYASRFAQSNNCGKTLAAGASCTISLTFSPNTTGTRFATLNISTNGQGGRRSVSLNGVGVAGGTPAAGLSPASLSFASQPVGTTSVAGTATLDNAGTAALSISSVTITGANPGDFAQANNCGSSLPAGSTCTFSITFTPAAGGSRSALLSVADNSAGSPQTVSLSGTGTTAAASLSPASLSLGKQAVNTKSGTLTATLTNGGNAALSLSSIALTGANPGDFAQTNTCGTSVAAGASCSISVTFDPTASGSRSASVSFTDNANGSPQSLGLSGTGTLATVSLSPTSLSFGNQSVNTTSGVLSATLTNGGNAALSLSSIALTGANPGDFAQTNTCGTSVAAGASCSISVTFDPTATGSRSASVSLYDNANGSPQSLGLSGTGTSATVSLSPTSLAFGNQSVNAPSGVLSATLTNGGNAALNLSSIALTGANPGDFAQTNTCGTSVAAGASCSISVTFDPTATGSRSASVSFTDNANGSPQSLGLSGTGTSATVSLSPSSLSFANQPISETSSTQVVTLTNGGNTALSISSLTITGTNAADFAEVADTCGSSVAAGANCSIGVAFTPSKSNSETASLAIADNATGSPQTVSLSGSGIHNVGLLWTPSSTSGVVGYNVYRGTTPGGENSTPLNSTPTSGATFTDDGVTAGATYYYVVTAVGSDGTQSPASAESSTTVPST